ncbi:MAG: hypothetical protein Kow00108_22920 [Calditrichia bacterium]
MEYKKGNITKEIAGLVGLAIRAGSVALGMAEVKKSIEKGRIDLVFFSEKLGSNARKQLLYYCNLNGILLVSMGPEKEWKQLFKINQKIIGFRKGPLSLRIRNIMGV